MVQVKPVRNSIWAAMSLSVAMAAFPLSPAAAQTASAEQIDELQSILVELFGGRFGGVTIVNFRGEPGASGSWQMLRAVSGATVTRRCFLNLQTPILANSPNVAPARHYGLDFATVRPGIAVVGESVLFTADHMASDEVGMFQFADAETAEEARWAFQLMADNCRGRY